MYRSISLIGFALLHAASAVAASPWARCETPRLPSAAPRAVGALDGLVGDLDALLADAVRRRVTPGMALLVLRRGRVIYRGAAGSAKVDSIFDVASLTKVVATATAVSQLVGAGRLRFDDRASKYLRPLRRPDKRDITVRQLALHTSGLHSVVYKGALTDTRPMILDRIWRSRMRARPGQRPRYSDIGYILLGELVAAVTGKRLDRYAAAQIFAPLRMCDTGFSPPASRRARLISPWPNGGKAGQVYDPLAARMAGVAGHAGLFSTLDDLGRFGQMLLDGGRLDGARVLTSADAARLTRRYRLPGGRVRGLGWLLAAGAPHRTPLSRASFGHSGFTGTSLWIDPTERLVIVLLSNRTFYEPHRSVRPLVRKVHGLVSGAVLRPPGRPVMTGLDRLVKTRFAALAGRSVGLITNRSAVDRRGRWIVDLIASAPRVKLRSLFVPEHGLSARVDRRIKDGAYTAPSGGRVPVYSLFGHRRRPDDRTLRGVDTLVFDVAAVGIRYYTYLATMGWAMEEASRRGLPFVVLDRPNPLGGAAVEGPLATDRRQTSTNYHPLPVRYGMTLGELARMYNRRKAIRARLRVIKLSGWRRDELFPDQGVPWRNPSPNIRSWRQALVYGAVGLVEGTNVSVGRGTDSPFLWFGAPWIDADRLATALNGLRLDGVHFAPASKTPRASRHRGKRCFGVRLLLVAPKRFRPVRTGVAIAVTLRRLFPKAWNPKRLYRLIRHPPTTAAILAGREPAKIARAWRAGLARFNRMRRRFLLY